MFLIVQLLTLFRFVSPFLLFYLVGYKQNYLFLIFLILILIPITDILDGYLARKFKVSSNFGYFFDAITDRFEIWSILFLFYLKFNLSETIIGIFYSRDILILPLGLLYGFYFKKYIKQEKFLIHLYFILLHWGLGLYLYNIVLGKIFIYTAVFISIYVLFYSYFKFFNLIGILSAKSYVPRNINIKYYTKDAGKYYEKKRWGKSQLSHKLDLFILKKLIPSSCIKNKKILDAGMGTGRFIDFFCNNGCEQYIGIDYSDAMIEFAKKNIKRRFKNKVEIFKKDLTKKLNFKDSEFDVVFCYRVLTHFDYSTTLKILKEFMRITKKNGIIIFDIHNLLGWHFPISFLNKYFHINLLPVIMFLKYGYFRSPFEYYYSIFEVKKIEKLFPVEKTIGIKFFPITFYILLEKKLKFKKNIFKLEEKLGKNKILKYFSSFLIIKIIKK